MKSKILLIFTSIIFLLCIIEISLRIISYFYILSQKQVNSESNNRENRQYIIHCFGDSYTKGMDDLPGYGGYPKRLEKLLNENFPERKFMVINCAGLAFNSSLTLLAVKKNLEKYNPRLIIVFIGANDHWNYSEVDPKIIQGYKKYLGSKYWIIKSEIFLSKFKTFKLFKICLINLKKFLSGKNGDVKQKEDKVTLTVSEFINSRCELIELYESLRKGKLGKTDFKKIRDYPGIIQSEQITKFNLLEIIRLAKSKGIKIVLQNYPDHYASAALQQIIHEVATDCQVPLVDNSLVFRKKLLQDNYEKYFVPNGHCNAKGYDVIADNLFKTLIDSGSLQ